MKLSLTYNKPCNEQFISGFDRISDWEAVTLYNIDR